MSPRGVLLHARTGKKPTTQPMFICYVEKKKSSYTALR